MEKRKIYKANYVSEVIKADSIITPDGFTSIEFYNYGNDNALINGNIPCDYNDETLKFINLPGTEIGIQFQIKFAFIGLVQNILVIKTYFK